MFKDDWIKYGFALYGHPANHFIIDYRSASHTGQETPLELAQKVARELHASYGPLTVMLSGGVDSQACAYAFKTADVPVKFVTVRYNDGLNDHDILSSEFYTKYEIEREIIEFDALAFHEDELLSWGERYYCTSPHLLTHMKLASMMSGTVVFSGCLVTPDGEVGNLDFRTFALERYSERSEQPVVGYFFSYDPALHASFSRMPHASVTYMDSYERKCLIYQEAGFPVIPQESKLHGFEKIKEHYDGRPISPRERLKHRHRVSRRPYDYLFRFALENTVGIKGLETKTLHK